MTTEVTTELWEGCSCATHHSHIQFPHSFATGSPMFDLSNQRYHRLISKSSMLHSGILKHFYILSAESHLFYFHIILYKQTFYQLSIFSSRNLLELWWLKFVCLSALAVPGNTESLAERDFWRLPKIPIVSRMIPDPRSGQTRQILQCSLDSGSAPSLDSLSQCCAVLLVKNCSEPLRSTLWSSISPFAITQKSFALSSFHLPIVRLSQYTPPTSATGCVCPRPLPAQ